MDVIKFTEELITKNCKVPKCELSDKLLNRNKLLSNIPRELILSHDAYYYTLSDEKKDFIDQYNADNYRKVPKVKIWFSDINYYLRTGKISEDIVLYQRKLLFPDEININYNSNEIAKKMTDFFGSGHFENYLKYYIKVVINTILNAPRIKVDVTLFRGEVIDTVEPKEFDKSRMSMKINDQFSQNGIISFSFDPSASLLFNRLKPCCIYRIKLSDKIEYPILFLKHPNYLSEIVFPPSTFKVVGKSKISAVGYSEITVYDIEFVNLIFN